MFKFINYFKKNASTISFVAVITVFCMGITLMVLSSTYAMSNHKVTFMEAYGRWTLTECLVDYSGKIEQDCLEDISYWCDEWSLEKYLGNNHVQSDPATKDKLGNMEFTDDEVYYCDSGTSTNEDKPGCYVCSSDSNLMTWDRANNLPKDCTGGYKLDNTISIDNCKVYACYECSTNQNIMEWRYTGLSDEKCPGGYNKTDKTMDECVPESCYVCKDDKNIMKWDTNGNPNNECASGFNPDPRNKNECKTIIPDACYVCNDNDNVFYWKNNGNADNNCSAGYKKTDLPESECKPVSNPPTGDITIFLVWVLGIGCLVYSVVYLRKQIVNVNE